jgi:hypothetical protein
MATILTSPFLIGYVLPFVLVFTVVFAILQKSGILGKDKKQIDAIVALVIGLVTISFANAVGIITSLLPFMAVAIVIILIFLILIAMMSVSGGEFELPKALKNTLIGLVSIAVVIAVMIATGAWNYVLDKWFYGTGEGLANFIFITAVLVAVAFVVWPKKKDG